MKIKNQIFESFDNLYKACKDYHNKTGVITPMFLQFAIEKAKWKIDTRNKLIEPVTKAYNKCCDKILVDTLNKTGSGDIVPLDKIRESIDEMKSDLEEAINSK